MTYDLYQIAYISRATEKPDVSSITTVSDENNKRDHITGLLVCDKHRFLQLIEGPREQVRACFDRIAADKRHSHIDVISSREISQCNLDKFRVICRVDPTKSAAAFVADVKDKAREIDDAQLQALFIGFASMAAR